MDSKKLEELNRVEGGAEINMKNKRNSWDYKKEHIRHKEKKVKYNEAKEE